MINAYFSVKETPFNTRKPVLLEQQQRAFDIILSQCQMHGLTLLIGQPGTGKTVVKEALRAHDEKRLAVPVVSRNQQWGSSIGAPIIFQTHHTPKKATVCGIAFGEDV